MVWSYRLALMTLSLVACIPADAAGPITFRLPADDKNENSESVGAVAFSPDGKLVAGAFGRFNSMLAEPIPGQVVIWDAQTGRRRAALLGHSDGVSAVAFSPDGKLIGTTGFPGEIKLWHAESAKEVASLQRTATAVCVAFSPDGKLLAVGLDTFGTDTEGEANLELYDVASRRLVHRLDGGGWGIASVAFSPKGGMLAAGGDDGQVRLWDTATGTPIAALRDQGLHDAVNRHRRLLAKRLEREIEDIPPQITSVIFSPDGRQLAVAGGQSTERGREYGIGAVTIWDVAAKKLQKVLLGYDFYVEQVQYSRDGKLLATAGADRQIRLWDVATFQQVGRFSAWEPIAFSPDGKGLISCGGGPVLELRRLADVPTTEVADKAEKEAAQRLIGLEKLWSVGHDTLWPNYDNYRSAVYDPRSRTIFALHYGECDVLGLDGKVRRPFKIERNVDTLRLARLSGADGIEFIAFSDAWGDSIIALDSMGKVLWEQATDAAVDDAWVADLDGDGQDEVIVGYNGSGGLHVYDHSGIRRWKNTALTNVWHVTAGNLLGDKKLEVIETSTGKVQIFDASGKALKAFDTPFEPFLARAVRLSMDDPFDTIIVAGHEDAGESIAAMGANGKVLWTKTELGNFRRIVSMQTCPNRPWVAFSGGGEERAVAVVDCRDGTIIAETGDKGSDARVAWASSENDDAPILLVATVRALSAYRVKP